MCECGSPGYLPLLSRLSFSRFRQSCQERSTQHESNLVSLEEKLFTNHGMRVIQMQADAMGCNPTDSFTN